MAEPKTKSFAAAPEQVKVWKARLVETGPKVTLIRVPISSTSVDRDGDEFSPSGLESMLAGLKSGKVPLYLDHGFRESGARLYGALDMLGAWIDGEIEGATLYGTAFLEPGNWLADELARKIEAGLPMGFSVGFGVVKSRDRPEGGLIFDEVSLWEVSAVGIPSNPDAVNSAAVQAVVKSLRMKAGLEKSEMPEEDLRKKKLKESEDEEEEQKTTEEEEREEEEEKSPTLTETELRQIVAEEASKAVAKAVETAVEPLIAQIKALVEKKPEDPKKKSPGPRGIVVVREENQVDKEKTPAAGPAFRPGY